MADPLVWGGLAAAAIGGVAGVVCARLVRREPDDEPDDPALADAARIRAEAEDEQRRLIAEAELTAHEEALRRREADGAALDNREAELARLDAQAAARAVDIELRQTAVKERQAALDLVKARVTAAANEERAHREARIKVIPEMRALLEKLSGESATALATAIAEAEREDARARAAQQQRLLEASTNDPEHGRSAKRIMGIAVGRFEGHYLTERHMSHVPLGEPRNGQPLVPVDALTAIEAVTNLKLTLSETQDSVRLEGLDGVAREVARRTLARLLRRPARDAAEVTALTRDFTGQVDREVADLGRRAFATLQIPKAHPDIVRLVGRLNWRTSYTQNQWKHAVEAAFLCGMMAEELGLDLRIARRAALIHDIGKALTHELDGSHAVIGADYARRLGETEVVANAIGAHHTDEPFNSPYAFLVAAGDAMSGARPGARRQTEDNYVTKLADLERITRGWRGVAEAFAVQGGREVRIYVQEDRVDDLGAVKLSSEIAETISREMTFPGQIKVTVIREFKAVGTAG